MTPIEKSLPDRVLDAVVEYRPIDPPPADATQLHEFQLATHDTTWLLADDIRVMVRGTDLVVVDVDPDGDRTMIEPLLYGWVMRVLFINVGTFNLHASLVRIGDEHVAIGGHSGAGKSTTVVSLGRRHGASLLIDDIIPIDLVDGKPLARPFPRPVHLTHDAVERMGLDFEGETIGRGPRGKIAVDVATPGEPVIVDRLVTLTSFDPTDESTAMPSDLTPAHPVDVRAVAGGERLRWVVRLSNSFGLPSFGDRAAPYFSWSTGVAAALPTIEVRRRSDADTLEAVCRAVIDGMADR